MNYGYARVSTRDQDLTAQIEALKAAGCQKIYKEKISGRNAANRKELNKLLKELQPGDTFTVTKIDRMARSLKDGLNLINDMREKGVVVNVLNMGVINNTPMGNLISTVMLAIAQFEADLTKERQAEGYEIAKREGRHLGRPRKYTEKNPSLMHALELYAQGDRTVRQICDITKVSRATLYRAAEEMGVVRQ